MKEKTKKEKAKILEFWRNKIHKARYVKNDKTFSKNTFDWQVPDDLQLLAKKYNKTFIGIGHWISLEAPKFICIATKNEIIYIERPLLNKLIQAMNLDGIEYIKIVKENLKKEKEVEK